MEIVKSLLCLAIIKCCCVIYSKSEVVSITLGDPGKELFVENGQPLLIHCILNTGNFDSSLPRSWLADADTLINDGNPTIAGSGYKETLDTDKFSLSTPPMDLNADGRVYRCNYIFSQTTLTVKINGIGSSDQSKGNCINGKSIKDCWFSLSKVIPGVSSTNLTAVYIDDMEENITSMLNETFQMNADGKTWDYWFNIVPNFVLLKNVKAITLSFMVGNITTSLTITVPIEDCSLDIFLYGFLPVFLIVLIVSIAIIIILKIERLPQQFGELAWKKLVIIAICFVVAIIIGVCLGLLIKGCDKKYLALGLSLLFGILIVVALIFALIYYHKKCESRREIQDGSDGGAQDGNGKSPKKTGSTTNKNTREKTGESKNNTGSNTTKNATERGGDSQNNTGSNATKTATERVGSPASTSNIELAAKNKAGVPKGEQSALKQKEINTPLPQPPSGNSQYLTASTNNLPVPRNNQLDPIVMENEEANPSERKKKKRKKKKRKNEKNADEAGDNEDEN